MNSHTLRNVSLLTMNLPLPRSPPLVIRVQVSWPGLARAGLGWAYPQGRVLRCAVLVLVRETITWSSASYNSNSKYSNREKLGYFSISNIQSSPGRLYNYLFSLAIITISLSQSHSPDNNDDSPMSRNVSGLTSSFPSDRDNSHEPVSRTLR